jgi:eukaryotic-like serine/threonine-protein kinase
VSDVAAELDASLRPGSVIIGKYRVERVLGAGGMAVVLAARDLRLGRLVALKVLRSDTAQNPELCQRFAREARVVAQMQSDHVPRVLDVDELPDVGQLLVLEYLEGKDLRRVLEAEGSLPVARAVDLVLDACEAVAEAHSLGIVHRDLKPANLLLERKKDGSEQVKVLDFGISKWLSAPEDDSQMTTNSDVFGSPLYMSPEQLRSSRYVTGRTDVWALAVILYELVSGQAPFDAESRSEVVGAVLHRDPKPLLELRPNAPLELWKVLERALHKDPGHRTPSVLALARELAPFGTERAQRSFASIERVCASGAGVETDADAALPEETSSQAARKRSRVWPAMLLGFAAGTVVLLVFAAQGKAPVVEPDSANEPAVVRAPPAAERPAAAVPTGRFAASSLPDPQPAPSLPASAQRAPRARPTAIAAARAPVPPKSSAPALPASASLPPICPDLRCERK